MKARFMLDCGVPCPARSSMSWAIVFPHSMGYVPGSTTSPLTSTVSWDPMSAIEGMVSASLSARTKEEASVIGILRVLDSVSCVEVRILRWLQ